MKKRMSIKDHDKYYQEILDYFANCYPRAVDGIYPRDLPFFDRNNFEVSNHNFLNALKFLSEKDYLVYDQINGRFPIHGVRLTPQGYKVALEKSFGLLSGSMRLSKYIRHQFDRVKDEGIWFVVSETIRTLIRLLFK